MTHNIGDLSSYYTQSAIQQQQGASSSPGTQGLSEAEMQQWLASYLSGSSSSASTQTSGAGSTTTACSGASSSNSNVNWQNLIQAQGGNSSDSSSGTTQTASADPTSSDATSSDPTSSTSVQGHHHHHHHGGGDAGSATQTSPSWFTDADADDGATTPTTGAGGTTPASFASLLNAGNTSTSVQSILDTLV